MPRGAVVGGLLGNAGLAAISWVPDPIHRVRRRQVGRNDPPRSACATARLPVPLMRAMRRAERKRGVLIVTISFLLSWIFHCSSFSSRCSMASVVVRNPLWASARAPYRREVSWPNSASDLRTSRDRVVDYFTRGIGSRVGESSSGWSRYRCWSRSSTPIIDTEHRGCPGQAARLIRSPRRAFLLSDSLQPAA